MLAYVFIHFSSLKGLQSSRKASFESDKALFVSQSTVSSVRSLFRNHTQRRPLPTQGGEGLFLDHTQPSGLMSDIKAMGFKDVHTLIDVMKSKATGELQDDKTYLMEHTIQVCLMLLEACCTAHGILACQWFALKIKNPSRFDQRLHRRAVELFAASAHVLSWRQICLQTG